MPDFFNYREIRDCYEFAHRMIGNHNPDIVIPRTDWEIFRDDFRGKLGEVAFRNYINRNIPNAVINCNIDFGVAPRGVWDSTDLIVNGRYVNVKSIKQGSRFLLIETLRYDEHGNYRYNNNNGDPVRVDMYVLVRVTIDPEIGPDDMGYHNILEFQNLTHRQSEEPSHRRIIKSEVLGGIDHDVFWRIKHFAPQGMRCDAKNLEAVCRGRQVEMLREGNVNEILQQNNFVIDSATELTPIERLL